MDVRTFLIADAGYNPYATVLATSEEFLKKNRAMVEAMVAAVREGWRAYLADPQPANTVMAGLNPTMDAFTFAEAARAQKDLIATYPMPPGGVGAMDAQRWDELAQQLLSLGMISVAPAASECFVDFSVTSPTTTTSATKKN